MAKKKQRSVPEINASSMADIAFLLLIFFLVTTTIASDKGLAILLPPKKQENDPTVVKLKDRNVFTVLLNSNSQLLVEEEIMDIKEIKEAAKKFIANPTKDEKLSESPLEAVISLKTDRGTNYEAYIRVMDELKRAYNELRAEHMGISLQKFLELENDPKQLEDKESEISKKYEAAKEAIPYRLSEAEPTKVGG